MPKHCRRSKVSLGEREEARGQSARLVEVGHRVVWRGREGRVDVEELGARKGFSLDIPRAVNAVRTSESLGFHPSSLRKKAMTVRNWLLDEIL